MIDCSHHPVVGSLADLLPYLDPAWRRRLEQSEFQLPQVSPHPGVEIEARAVPGADDPAVAAAGLSGSTEAVILIPSQSLAGSGWLNHEMAQRFAGAVNDLLIDRWLPADERFRLAIAVQSHDPALAVREIERLGDHPRVAAVVTSLIRVNMGQSHYHPIYAAAAARGLPVIVHPGGFEGMAVGPAELGGVGPYAPEEQFALLPQVAMSNLMSLIFDGVFVRYPELRVVFAGFGFAWAVPLLWRADAEWRGLRAEVPWLERAPTEYAHRHIRFVLDGAAEVPSASGWKLAEMLPPGMLVYGSDAPLLGSGTAERLAGAPDGFGPALADNARGLFRL